MIVKVKRKNVDNFSKSPPCVKEGGTRSVTGGLFCDALNRINDKQLTLDEVCNIVNELKIMIIEKSLHLQKFLCLI